MRALSVFVFFAAAFGAFVAVTTHWVMCHGEFGGSTMCPQGEPTGTMTAQLIVGLVGVVPPLVMIAAAFRDKRRAALAALVVGLILWAGWAFLIDAAVHGWGSDMRFVP
jgi:hypothetical protein